MAALNLDSCQTLRANKQSSDTGGSFASFEFPPNSFTGLIRFLTF